jgi:GT2 family glycosyltransferase
MSEIENTSLEVDDVSVVIATLGGESLLDTISQLNKGSIIPREILVCIPNKEVAMVEGIAFPNVKVLKTECRGQVTQRIEGFKNASCPYVMQLDDDMTVEHDCIKHLLSTIKLYGPNAVVAPSLVNISTSESAYKKTNRNFIVESIIYWCVNGFSGYQPGKIDKSGTPIGVDANSSVIESLDIEWLAGGCIMHRKENLVLDDFYPFKGKAFGEDVIHSILLKNKGVKLLIEPKAICSLEIIPSSNYSLSEFLSSIRSDYKVRQYYLGLISRKSIRIYLYYLFCVVGYVSKKTAAKFNE